MINNHEDYDRYLSAIVPAEELLKTKLLLNLELPTTATIVNRELGLRREPLFIDYVRHMQESLPLPNVQDYLNDYVAFFAAIKKHRMTFRIRFEKKFPPAKVNQDIDFRNIDDIELLQKTLSEYRVKLADYRISFIIHDRYTKALYARLEEYVRATIPNVLAVEIDTFIGYYSYLAAYENML